MVRRVDDAELNVGLNWWGSHVQFDGGTGDVTDALLAGDGGDCELKQLSGDGTSSLE